MIRLGEPLVRACVQRPTSTLAVSAALVILGVFSLTQMKLAYVPEVPSHQLLVACDAPGFPPDEIRKLVTLPLEDTLSSLKGLKTMRSFSRSGQSILQMELWWGTDLRQAQVEAAQLVDLAFERLPQSASKPTVLSLSENQTPSFWVSLVPRSGDLVQAREAAEREFRTRLQQTEGVGGVTIIGGENQEVRVDVDQQKLFAKGLSLTDVAQALGNGNVEVPLGTVESQGRDLTMKADAKAKTLTDLGSILILGSKAGQAPVAVSDVADVKLAPERQRSFFFDDQNEGVLFLVGRQPGHSPLAVSDRLKETLATLNQQRGRDFTFTLLHDESTTVRAALIDLAAALVLGSLIAFLTLFLFVRDFRSALILTSALPLSSLLAFLALWLLGRSLNVMTLGGLALGLGMLVDNSVVVLENFSKRIHDPQPSAHAVVEATMEMAGSTIGSTLTVAIVFVPLVFLPGVLGTLFTDLSLSVVTSMAASFFVSITWVPVLYLQTRKKPRKPSARRAEGKDPSEQLYNRWFRWGLRHPALVGASVTLCFVVAAVAFVSLKKELFNPIDQGVVEVKADFPPGSSVQALKTKTKAIEATLKHDPAVERILSFGGQESDSPYFLAHPQKPIGEITAEVVVRPGQSALALARRWTRAYPHLGITVPPSPLEALLNSGTSDSPWVLKANSPEQLDREKQRLYSHPLVVVPESELQPLYLVKPRTDQDTQRRLEPAAAAQALSGDLDGIPATDFWKDGFPLPVRVTLPEADKNDLAALERIQIPVLDTTRSGAAPQALTLASVATITSTANEPLLLRVDKKDALPFKLKADASPAQRTEFAKTFPDAQNVQEGLLEENASSLTLLEIFALVFLYLYLVVQFESYSVPLLVLLTFPLSAAGLFGSLALAGSSWNVNTFFSVLIVLGSSVNVAIILVETYRRRGELTGHPIAVVLAGTRERVRPILITTMTTIVGTLPVAIDPGSHSTQSGMAIALIGGHLVSAFLTLGVIPYLYLWGGRRAR